MRTISIFTAPSTSQAMRNGAVTSWTSTPRLTVFPLQVLSLFVRRAVVLGVVFLIGCVSVPKAAPEVQAAARRFEVVPDKAQLYIVRPSSFGAAILYQVTIDERIVGSLAAETFLLQTLDPGKHEVSFFNAKSQESTTLALEAGKNYFLRVGMNPGSAATRARFKLVPEEEGKQLVRTNPMASSSSSPHQ